MEQTIKISELWYREQTRTFHVTIDVKQHNLKTADRAEAYLRLADVLRLEPDLDMHTIRDRLLGGIEGIRAESTIGWYRFALSSRDAYTFPN